MQDKISTKIETMLSLARQAQKNAYAPYSHFLVGCCIRTASGDFFSGANVENVSYPLGICAERAACSALVNAGHRHITDILVIGPYDKICPPCGACRQFLTEFGGADTEVHLCNDEGLERSLKLSGLLPLAFMSDSMMESKQSR
jgi:cytidine deaminase